MARNSAWTCAEPASPPLSDRAREAAAECHDYALAQGLVLTLLTDEHLQYHNSVVQEEAARIPHGEGMGILDDSHLPPLEIPSTVISEAWTVHQRVAAVLEAACRWLPDAQRRACEAAILQAGGKKRKSAKQDVHSLKLDPPLLCSDHREDCAELRRLVAWYEDRAGTRLKCQQESDEIEFELFAIPEEHSLYAKRLEEELVSGTITVQEQTIRWLMAHLDSLEWREEVEDEEDDRQPQRIASRRLSTPLPPVLSVDEYVPEGDVCLVSDVSDLSSSMSEYAAKAEEAIPRKECDYKGVDEPTMARVFEPATSTDFPISQIDIAPFPPGSLEEDDVRMFHLTSPATSPENGDAGELLSWNPSHEDAVVSDRLSEYINMADVVTAYDERQRAPETEDVVKDSVSPCNNSPSSAQEEGFEAVSIDALLALQENESLELAKIPVPPLSTNRYQPEWSGEADSPIRLFQYMMHSDVRPQPSWPDDEFDAFVAGGHKLPEDTWEGDEIAEAELTAWIRQSELDTKGVLSFWPLPELKMSEEPLTPWTPPPRAKPSDKQRQSQHDMPSQPPATPEHKSSPVAEPRKDPEGSSTWGSLMTLFKRRKHDSRLNEQAAERPCIKAPELLIGSRTFADARPAPSRQEDGQENSTPQSTAEPDTIKDAMMHVTDTDTDTDTDLAVSGDLPKVILSTAIPRPIRSRILKLLPGLRFVERDYRQNSFVPADMAADDEADIVASPGAGVILATMVSLRQMDGHGRPIFEGRLAQMASKYDTLHVVVYRHNARDNARDDSLEPAPSDALAFSRLSGFAKSLLGCCDVCVCVSYVSGGERGAAQCAAALLNRDRTDRDKAAEKHLAEAATRQELLMRRAGLNVYAAQAVLGLIREDIGEDIREEGGGSLVEALLEKTPDQRVRLFQALVGSGRALDEVNRCLQ